MCRTTDDARGHTRSRGRQRPVSFRIRATSSALYGVLSCLNLVEPHRWLTLDVRLLPRVPRQIVVGTIREQIEVAV